MLPESSLGSKIHQKQPREKILDIKLSFYIILKHIIYENYLLVYIVTLDQPFINGAGAILEPI